MSRTSAPPIRALACIVVAAVLSGCGDDATKPAPSGPAAPAVAQGTAPVSRGPDPKVFADSAKAGDEVCRGLLDSFQRNTYDPRRHGRMEHAEGTIDVRTGGKDAKYRFAYDASNPPAAPVKVAPVSEPPGLKPGLAADVKRWAILSCAGGYALVVCYRPPIQLSLLPSSKKGSFTVFAPPFKTDASASYSIDERQVVEARAEWTDPRHAFTTNYEWDLWHGSTYLLRRSVLFNGPTTDFEYDDSHGPRLVGKVHVLEGDQRTEAVFTYEAVRVRPQ